jgi:hypothetical protein
MKKFEYSVMNIGDTSSEELKQFLDNMGDQNWELIQMEDGRAIFKRELPKPKQEKQLLQESYDKD